VLVSRVHELSSTPRQRALEANASGTTMDAAPVNQAACSVLDAPVAPSRFRWPVLGRSTIRPYWPF
jgi:hypothetical protein